MNNYRFNGFLVLTTGILSLFGGGWLLWDAFQRMTQTKATDSVTGSNPWLWTMLQLGLSLFLLFLAIRFFMDGVKLLNEEDSFLLFLPTETWPMLMGLVAIIALGVEVTSRLQVYFTSKRPKQCISRQPMSAPASGPEWACYDGGKWARAGYWKDGKKHGVWKEWFKNGRLKWAGSYLNGMKHGKFGYFNTLGRQVTSYRYKHNKLHGPYILRHNRAELTPLKLQGYYQKGKKCGHWVYWDAFMRQGLMQQKKSHIVKHKACVEEK